MTLQGLAQLLGRLNAPTDGIQEVVRHIGECKQQLSQAKSLPEAHNIVEEYQGILTTAVDGIKAQAKTAYRKKVVKLKLAIDAHDDKEAEKEFIELTKISEAVQKVEIIPPRVQAQPQVRRGVRVAFPFQPQAVLHRQGVRVYVQSPFPTSSTTATATTSATYVTFMKPF